MSNVFFWIITNRSLSLIHSDSYLNVNKKYWINHGQTHFQTTFFLTSMKCCLPLFTVIREILVRMPWSIVGALILKEFNGLTGDEILEECESDFRYHYALHTISYENQPLSGRTFSRFRERVAAYELVTIKDLIHNCIVSLAENMRNYMDIAPDRKSVV